MTRVVPFLILAILLSPWILSGQDSVDTNGTEHTMWDKSGRKSKKFNGAMHTRNFVWTTPVKKNTTINGIALGLLETTPWMGADQLKINGLNTDVSLFGVFGGWLALIGTVASPFLKNGLIRSTRMSGIAINAVISFADINFKLD